MTILFDKTVITYERIVLWVLNKSENMSFLTLVSAICSFDTERLLT